MKKLKEKLSAKLKKQGGFTLVEMLIVVAIIAILIVISMPLIGANLEKARIAVDEANERTAMSMAETYFLLNSKDATMMTFTADASGNRTCDLYYAVNQKTHQGKIENTEQNTDMFSYGQSTKAKGTSDFATGTPSGNGLKITISDNGDVTALEWKAGK